MCNAWVFSGLALCYCLGVSKLMVSGSGMVFSGISLQTWLGLAFAQEHWGGWGPNVGEALTSFPLVQGSSLATFITHPWDMGGEGAPEGRGLFPNPERVTKGQLHGNVCLYYWVKDESGIYRDGKGSRLINVRIAIRRVFRASCLLSIAVSVGHPSCKPGSFQSLPG